MVVWEVGWALPLLAGTVACFALSAMAFAVCIGLMLEGWSKDPVTGGSGSSSLDNMDQSVEPLDPTLGSTSRRARTDRRWMLLAALGAGFGIVAAAGGYLAWAHAPPALSRSIPAPLPDPKMGELGSLLAELGDRPAASDRWLDPQTDAADARKLAHSLPPRRAPLARLSRLMREHAPFPTARPYPSEMELYSWVSARAWQNAQIKAHFYEENWGEGLRRCLELIEIGGKIARKGHAAPQQQGLSTALAGALMAEHFIPQLSALEAQAVGNALDVVIAAFPTESDLHPRLRAGRMRDVASWLEHDEPYTDWVRSWKVRLPPSAEEPMVGLLKFLYPRPVVYAQVDDRSEVQRRELQKPSSQRRHPAPATDPLARGFLSGWTWTELEHLPACRTQLQLLRVELAIQEHRRATGAYPKALSELHCRVSKSQLIDPMSDKPMSYRYPRTWKSPTTRFPYLLYSYGLDREDGGGRKSAGYDTDPRPGRDLVAGEILLR